MISKFEKYCYKAAAIIIFIAGLGLLISLLIETIRDNDRLRNNNDALLSETEIYKAENGNLAYENKVIQLSLNEAREIQIPELQREIDNLNLKLKRVSSFSQVVVNVSDTLLIPIYDTVIRKDTVLITAKSFNYQDEFAHINGAVYKDSLALNYSITDSIIQFVYKGKYNKWYDWILFRKRPLYQVITAKNPKTKILFSRVITIREKGD